MRARICAILAMGGIFLFAANVAHAEEELILKACVVTDQVYRKEMAATKGDKEEDAFVISVKITPEMFDYLIWHYSEDLFCKDLAPLVDKVLEDMARKAKAYIRQHPKATIEEISAHIDEVSGIIEAVAYPKKLGGYLAEARRRHLMGKAIYALADHIAGKELVDLAIESAPNLPTLNFVESSVVLIQTGGALVVERLPISTSPITIPLGFIAKMMLWQMGDISAL